MASAGSAVTAVCRKKILKTGEVVETILGSKESTGRFQSTQRLRRGDTVSRTRLTGRTRPARTAPRTPTTTFTAARPTASERTTQLSPRVRAPERAKRSSVWFCFPRDRGAGRATLMRRVCEAQRDGSWVGVLGLGDPGPEAVAVADGGH